MSNESNQLRIYRCSAGTVMLDAFMADDLSVVNSARVSFGKRSEEMTNADKGLVNFLMRERHGTPFEHNSFRFHVKCPIFVAREWFRHRMGSFNEFSGRYAEFDPEGYLPMVEEMRTQVGKPGSYTFEPIEKDVAEEAIGKIYSSYGTAFETYQKLLDAGVAKEVARIVLPVGVMTEFYWTVNARSLMNFISLRQAATAQYEIRTLALGVEQFFSRIMPVTYEAFIQNGRVAP
jgi:thymidylate synthase (FAD)